MNITFIGGGHMARALIGGLHAQGTTNITVVERNINKCRQLAADFAVKTLPSIPPSSVTADAVVLAVRPAQMREVCLALKHHNALMISIAAGLRLADLTDWLGDKAIVRVMPNTPAEVGMGMSVCCGNDTVNDACRHLTETIFNAVGLSAWVADERLLETVTAVSGSGPAYVYYFIDAMQQAAMQMGMSADVALPAILQTVRGAVAMLEKGDHNAADLCTAVAVKGGTTEQALAVFDGAQMAEIIAKAMQACAGRAREIGDELADTPE